MQHLLKNTYLMDIEKIQKSLDGFWKRYQDILEHPNWEDLNEARAILYLIGHIYCEQIAPKAIERRLHLLKKPMTLIEFLSLVDSGQEEELTELRKDELFSKLEEYYRLVRDFKNKFNGGKFYFDEERFIALYNKHNPDKKLKIGYRGKI